MCECLGCVCGVLLSEKTQLHSWGRKKTMMGPPQRIHVRLCHIIHRGLQQTEPLTAPRPTKKDVPVPIHMEVFLLWGSTEWESVMINEMFIYIHVFGWLSKCVCFKISEKL